MTDYQAFALTLLSSAGVSVALSGAVIWLARSWIAERLRASIKHEYDEKLATLTASLNSKNDVHLALIRADVDHHAERVRTASASVTEAHKVAFARTLQAADVLWNGVITARAHTPAILSFLDILVPSEFVGAVEDKTFKNLTSALSFESIAQDSLMAKGDVEAVRPYIGEYAWALYITHIGILFRIAYLAHKATTDPSKMNWHTDSGVRQLLQSALHDDGLNNFDSVQIGKITWIRAQFEGRLLQATGDLIAGKEFSASAQREAQRMKELLLKIPAEEAGG